MNEPTHLLKMFFYLIGSMILALFSMYERAHAYVPRARTILEKTVGSHGKGAYLVQLEVNFRGDAGTTTVLEKWTVENAESMYLEAKGGGNSVFEVIKGKQKYFLDENDSERAAILSPDFFEGVLYYRTWESLAQALVHYKIINHPINGKEPKIKTPAELLLNKEPFLRLSRSDGVVNYAFGTPTPVDSASLQPGMWIEQDRFFIRKLRSPTQAEFSADDYSEYSQGLWYPKSRLITWGGNTVSIRTVKVTPIALNPEVRQRLQSGFFRAKKSDGYQTKFSAQESSPIVREFYQRFR